MSLCFPVAKEYMGLDRKKNQNSFKSSKFNKDLFLILLTLSNLLIYTNGFFLHVSVTCLDGPYDAF